MDEKKVRLAVNADLQEILAVYAHARQFMEAQGNGGQWGKTHPPAQMLEEDIRKQQLYVITQNEDICGVFAFIPGEDPTYGYIEGRWNSQSRYGTIHRIAGNGSAKGIFAACIAFCEEKSPYLRIDTHECKCQ